MKSGKVKVIESDHLIPFSHVSEWVIDLVQWCFEQYSSYFTMCQLHLRRKPEVMQNLNINHVYHFGETHQHETNLETK